VTARRGAIVAAAVADQKQAAAAATTTVAEPPSTSSSSAAVAHAADVNTKQQQQQKPAGASKWVIDENELLTSTNEHRLWTFGPMAVMALAFGVAMGHVHTAGDALAAAGAFLAAYTLADFGTGVYHWGVDNYGDGQTPVFGRQIAAFQGHHQRPWTITQREFCNNLHQVFKPAATPAVVIAAASPFLPLFPGVFLPSFLFLVCMSQQFHAWSHMKKSELPAVVVALQDAGVLIGRAAHGAHHRPNFEGNYCIVSGWWNGPLDRSGFFRALEQLVVKATGVEPRCWYAPDHAWAEQAPPGSAAAAGAAAE
jgi:ubiquitin-conjugating enzyme E2 variant